MPDGLRSGRFGVKAYHDPDLMVALQSIAPEARLLDLIDVSELFCQPVTRLTGPGKFDRPERDFWEGSSLDLEKYLLHE